jgi:glycosyltransferase involved in cell wall biosynthesis
MPAISILLPCKNAAATLGECLDSIAAQTWEDYELLLVDDASSDGSRALAVERAARDPRIRPLVNSGRGLVAALNQGLAHARGELVARMDADDRMYPERLMLQAGFLRRNPHIGLVGSRVRVFPAELVQAGYREYERWQNQCLSPRQIADHIYLESPLAHPSVMFRRRWIERVGGYREGPFPEDYELWLRLHAAGCPMAKLPEVLLDWREGPERTSRRDPRYAREAFDRLRADYLARDPRLLRRRGELVIWGAGRRTRKRCRQLLGRGFAVQAWVDIDPCKIGNFLQGVPVVSPDWLRRSPRPLVLCYVGNHGARELIGLELHAMGYRRGRDYLAVG